MSAVTENVIVRVVRVNQNSKVADEQLNNELKLLQSSIKLAGPADSGAITRFRFVTTSDIVTLYISSFDFY